MGLIDNAIDAFRFKDTIFYKDSNELQDKYNALNRLNTEFPNNKDPKINVALNDNKTKAHFGFDEVISMYGDLDAVSKIGNNPNFSKSN